MKTPNTNIEIVTRRLHGTAVTWFCAANRTQPTFERQFPLPDGMTYNSYLIAGEKLAIVDTVDPSVAEEWINALKAHLTENHHGKTPAYLIVQHLEPDHSSAIAALAEAYPEMQIICSEKAAAMLPQFAPEIAPGRVTSVKENHTLDLGNLTLRFFMAPMVHWPEVMVTYLEQQNILFSADAFGTFGSQPALQQATGSPQDTTYGTEWLSEARRYYYNIVGKFGAAVNALLRKIEPLAIDVICPLHGPILNLSNPLAVECYKRWASWQPDKPQAIAILTTSFHGNTLQAAYELENLLRQNGLEAQLIDLSATDPSYAVAHAFACGAAVFISPTYDGDLPPAMRSLLGRLHSKGYRNRKIALVENGSWAPMAAKLLYKDLSALPGITFIGDPVTIHTRVDNTSRQALQYLATAITQNI